VIWRKLLAGAAALLLASCGEPSPPSTQVERPLLWQIARADGEVEGWLYGTIHALPDGVEWRSPTLQRVIGRADFLVVEVADLKNSAAIGEEFQRAGRSTGHPLLRDRVDPAKVAQLNELTGRTAYSASEFRQIETWAAALMLAQTINNGLESENGVDRALLGDFGNRQVIELEGAAAQFAIFDALAEEDQRVLLDAVIDEAAAGGLTPNAAQVWLSGDVAMLERETQSGMLADPEVRDALLVRRNSEWTDRIAALLADDRRPLVAVGAAHLVGVDGLIALLERKGYRLRRLQ
jgi:uncharacterized protein